MFLAAVANGFSSWLPAAIGRTWALTPREIGRVLGPLGMLTGPLTLLGFGYLLDPFGPSSPGAAMRGAFFRTGIQSTPDPFIFFAPGVTLVWPVPGATLPFDFPP